MSGDTIRVTSAKKKEECSENEIAFTASSSCTKHFLKHSDTGIVVNIHHTCSKVINGQSGVLNDIYATHFMSSLTHK